MQKIIVELSINVGSQLGTEYMIIFDKWTNKNK